MIRHYESIGVIPKAGRSLSGYRVYNENDVHVLRFVKRARALGFSMAEIRKLLLLWRGRRPSVEVKRLALAHVAGLRERISDMQEMVNTLAHLASHCHGDERPECPILEGMREGEAHRLLTPSTLRFLSHAPCLTHLSGPVSGHRSLGCPNHQSPVTGHRF